MHRSISAFLSLRRQAFVHHLIISVFYDKFILSLELKINIFNLFQEGPGYEKKNIFIDVFSIAAVCADSDIRLRRLFFR